MNPEHSDTAVAWDDRPGDRRARDRLCRVFPDDAITDVMRLVPRHAFLPALARADAYRNAPLAIGAGQTISQPQLVHDMLADLQLQPGQVVWDIGAGSGYAAYLLAELVGPDGVVYADERQGSLARSLAQRLQELPAAAAPLFVRHADASTPPDEAVDRIHVGCVWEDVPEVWFSALKPSGRLVVPVGQPDEAFIRVYFRENDEWHFRQGAAVAFVPGLPETIE